MKVLVENSLIGRTALVSYKDSEVQVRFDNNNSMFWSLNENDNYSFGYENISYRKINDHLFSICWTEESGAIVNQLIDTRTNTLTAVLSTNKMQRTIFGDFKFIS